MDDAFELKNGHIFVIAETPGGIYNPEQLKELTKCVENDMVFLKATENGRVGFMMKPDQFDALSEKLGNSGVQLRHYRQPTARLSPNACLGELCPKHKQKALEDALDLGDDLTEKMQESQISLNIGMNGCGLACVNSATNDMHLVGGDEGYDIYLGGKAAQIPELSILAQEAVPREKLKDVLFLIIDTFVANRSDECLTMKDVVEVKGIQVFSDAIDEMLHPDRKKESDSEIKNQMWVEDSPDVLSQEEGGDMDKNDGNEKEDFVEEQSLSTPDEKDVVPPDEIQDADSDVKLPVDEKLPDDEVLMADEVYPDAQPEGEESSTYASTSAGGTPVQTDHPALQNKPWEQAENTTGDKLHIECIEGVIRLLTPDGVRLKFREDSELSTPLEILTSQGMLCVEAGDGVLHVEYQGLDLDIPLSLSNTKS